MNENNNYIVVINETIDELLSDLSDEQINEYKKNAKELINSEKEYEFNDERPRIKTLLDILIK